jgi:serine/threonine-protein kinase
MDEPTIFALNTHNVPNEGDLEFAVEESLVVERYQIGDELARGGIGRIFKCRDHLLNREVAVKMLRTRFRDDPQARRRFMNEARIVAMLEHPSIVPIYDFIGLPCQFYFIVMPLIRGTTLGKQLAARSTPREGLRRYLSVFAQVCQALAYVHGKGVIHRDLKPANIMLGPLDEVFVMDWGIARVLDEATAAERSLMEDSAATSAVRVAKETSVAEPGTELGRVLGSPGYMAPEQARGETDRVDKRADVFGLGAILCVILTGKGPYRGKENSELLRRARRASTRGAFFRLDASGCDPELITLAKRCLSAAPDDRPNDAGEVAEWITRYRETSEKRFPSPGKE